MNIKSARGQSFLTGFLGIILVLLIFLSGLNVAPEVKKIVSPQSDIKDPFDQVRLKLEDKKNTVKLTRSINPLIKEAQAEGEFSKASSYIVVNADSGEIISEKSPSQALYIASLTKTMTAIVASDLAPLDEEFIVSDNAPKVMPTSMGLIPGQRWKLKELLHGLLLTSANDAAQVIKEGIDAKLGEGTFVKAMNAKARLLGLKNTSFANPQGFDDLTNYSTSEDLAVLSLYLFQNYPSLAEIAQKDFQAYPQTASHKQADLYNWNGLLDVYPGIYGLKIGNTEKAAKTTIVAAKRDGKKVLVVLLGAPGILERDLWASQLLDLGFAKEFNLQPVNVKEESLKNKYLSWR